jgi:hypothetical protein
VKRVKNDTEVAPIGVVCDHFCCAEADGTWPLTSGSQRMAGVC